MPYRIRITRTFRGARKVISYDVGEVEDVGVDASEPLMFPRRIEAEARFVELDVEGYSLAPDECAPPEYRIVRVR